MTTLPDPSEPVHIRSAAWFTLLRMVKDGALPIEEIELAASEGNTLAVELLVALETEEAAP